MLDTSLVATWRYGISKEFVLQPVRFFVMWFVPIFGPRSRSLVVTGSGRSTRQQQVISGLSRAAMV